MPEPRTDPLFNSAALMAESQRLCGDPCCGDAAWGGRLCQYHSGFRDALDLAEQHMEAGKSRHA